MTPSISYSCRTHLQRWVADIIANPPRSALDAYFLRLAEKQHQERKARQAATEAQ
jgi:hypothetical protein